MLMGREIGIKFSGRLFCQIYRSLKKHPFILCSPEFIQTIGINMWKHAYRSLL
jgi:hypothetical protein